MRTATSTPRILSHSAARASAMRSVAEGAHPVFPFHRLDGGSAPLPLALAASSHDRSRMLAPDEPPAVEVVNPHGRSTAFLTCDHASHRVPRSLGDLGLTPAQLTDHIGWDPGAARVARRLSELLDAPLVLSGYSRLVIDCNRPEGVPTSIAKVSGGVTVPGNANVSDDEARVRAKTLLRPYHAAIAGLLDERARAGQATHYLAIHTFTPRLLESARPWHIGMVYGRDARLAHAMLRALREDPALVVGDNEPYRVSETTDFGIPVHAEARGLPGVLVEIRNDGPATDEGVARWAQIVADAWRAAAAAMA